MANNVLDRCTVRNSAHKDEPVTDTRGSKGRKSCSRMPKFKDLHALVVHETQSPADGHQLKKLNIYLCMFVFVVQTSKVKASWAGQSQLSLELLRTRWWCVESLLPSTLSLQTSSCRRESIVQQKRPPGHSKPDPRSEIIISKTDTEYNHTALQYSRIILICFSAK